MKKIILSLMASLGMAICYAQPELIQKELNSAGTVSFAEFPTDTLQKQMSNAKAVLKDLLALQPDDDFVLADSKSDELGFTHYYYTQYYKGIRVAYGSYAVHGKNNIVHTANGTYNRITKVVTTPKIQEREALSYATRYINAKTYKWEIPEEEAWLKANYGESYYPKGELVIVKDKLITNQQFRLAWKFDVYAHYPLSRNLVYVDAVSGEIVDIDSKIHNDNANGTADTRYSGTRNIVADSFTGGFRLRETRNSVRIETYNMRNQGANYFAATDFVDNNNNWTAAEFNNANSDNAALDAHWGTEMVYDYFNTVHGRNSWNGSGGPLFSYVHTNLVALGYPDNGNAFWDGQRMTYGDGTFCFSPLTALDVCAHEIGHGINSSSARMKYEGESGALNEALSDIWGACVEQWAAPAKATWLLGEDIFLCGASLRSMSNPNAQSQPDTYQSPLPNGFWFNTNGCTPTNTNDRCGVHTNSGVPNFWFFLLTNGGAGTNDLGNCFNVSGIGIDRASRIVYRAETIILASTSEQFVSFNQFRNATITAASDLYGANSLERVSVMNAWFAVGVGAAYTYTAADISGNVACTSNASFTLAGAPTTGTVSWSASPASYFTPSSGTGSTATLHASSSTISGQGTLTFTVSTNCNTVQVSKVIWAGKPNYNITLEPDFNYVTLYMVGKNGDIHNEGITSTSWVKLSGTGIFGGSGFQGFGHGAGNWYVEAQITATNACGSLVKNMTVQPPPPGPCGSGVNALYIQDNGGNSYSLERIIDPCFGSVSGNTALSKTSDSSIQVVVLSLQGEKVMEMKSFSDSWTLNGIRPGIYIMQVLAGDQLFTKRVLVQ